MERSRNAPSHLILINDGKIVHWAYFSSLWASFYSKTGQTLCEKRSQLSAQLGF